MTDETTPDEVPTQDDYIEQVTTEAKKTFNLRNMLQGRTARTAKLQIFLNQEDLIRYQTIDATIQRLVDNLAAMNEDDEKRPALMDQHNALEESFQNLKAKLLSESIIVHLRSVPQVTLDVLQAKIARRWAKRVKEAEGSKEALAQGEVNLYMQREHAWGLIRAAIQRIVAQDGSEAELHDEIGKDLAETLSPNEYQRLDAAIQQMIFNDNLGRLATDEPGF